MLKKVHPSGSENTPILHFEIKITKMPREKLSNTTNPNVPLSMGVMLLAYLH